MRRHAVLLLLFLAPMVIGGWPLSAQQKPVQACEPNFSIDAPGVTAEREAKKGRMRKNGVPERYLHLLDQYRCAWCLKTAPDAVHVTIVYKDEFAPRLSDGRIDKIYTIRLLPQIERQLRDDLSTGRIESFHVFISEKRCRCCPGDDKQAEDYDDWDDDLGANTDQVDSFDDPSDLPPLPDDLKNAPSGWVPPPPIEKFEKPRRRYLHVVCDACQKLADQWNDVAGTLDYLWDRKLSLQRQMNVTANAIGNRENDINDLEYQQRFTTSRTFDQGRQIEKLQQINADQQSGIERQARQLADVEQQIAETQARLDAIMQKVLECEKTCKKTTATNTTAATTGSTGPMLADAPAGNAAQPPVTSDSAQIPGVCLACQAAATAVADLEGSIAGHRADLARLAQLQSVNASQIENLTALRADAQRLGDQGRVDQLGARIKTLQQQGAELRAEAFGAEQQITALNEALADAVRLLDDCLRRCGQDMGAMNEYRRYVTATGSTGVPRRIVGVNPITLVAECKDCEPRLKLLQDAHRELQRLMQEANNLQDESALTAFEEQRSRVATLENELRACNATCKERTTTSSGDLNTTGVNTTGVNTAAPIPSVCPECRAAATAVAELESSIAARTAELQRLGQAQGVNESNLANLSALRARAARDGEARVNELSGRIAELHAANAQLRSDAFTVQQDITRLNEALAEAVRLFEECLRRCGQTMAAMPEYGRFMTGGTAGVTAPKRTVEISPLPSLAVCPDCQPLAIKLRAAYQELERLKTIANDLQMQEDFERFETQRAAVAELQDALKKCVEEKCRTTTTSNGTLNTTGNRPAAVIDAPAAPGFTATATAPATNMIGAASLADQCKRCEEIAEAMASARSDMEDARREMDRYEVEDSAIRTELRARYDQESLLRQRLEASRDQASAAWLKDMDSQIKEATAQRRAVESAYQRNATAHRESARRFTDAQDRLWRLREELEGCQKACGGTGGTGNAGDPPPPVEPERVCDACQDLANRVAAAKTNLNALNARLQNIRANQELLRAELKKSSGDAAKAQNIQGQLNQLTQAFNNTIKEQTAAIADVNRLEGELTQCKARCATSTANEPIGTTGGTATTGATGTPANTAFGPIDQDCRVPGTPCPYAYTPRGGTDWGRLNLNDPIAWGNVVTVTIELKVQRIGSDVIDPANFPHLAQSLAPTNVSVPQPDQQPPPEVVIPPTETPKVGAWFNPLGLLARRLVDHVDRWRGSLGPRPLITPRDLALIDGVSSTQSLGLPKGLHFLMVHQGGSTGKTVAMQVLNLSGKPVRLQAMPFVMEPLQRQAQEQVQKAFSKLSKLAPVRLDLNAYCTEFLKLPPTPNTIMRLAPPEIQKQFEPMSKVLRSAYRIKNAGLLHPDSNPAAYTDSIKQWAIWTVEQKLNESRYVDAFLSHTKKNMEGGGQKWSKQAEDVIRQVSPNRWRDIAQILRGAGVAVPQ